MPGLGLVHNYRSLIVVASVALACSLAVVALGGDHSRTDNWRFVTGLWGNAPTGCAATEIGDTMSNRLVTSGCVDASPGSVIVIGSQIPNNYTNDFQMPMFSNEGTTNSNNATAGAISGTIELTRFYVRIDDACNSGYWHVIFLAFRGGPTIATCDLAVGVQSCDVAISPSVIIAADSGYPLAVAFEENGACGGIGSAIWLAEAELL